MKMTLESKKRGTIVFELISERRTQNSSCMNELGLELITVFDFHGNLY